MVGDGYIAKRVCYMLYTVYISTGTVSHIMNAWVTDRGNMLSYRLYIGPLYINDFVCATNNSFVYVTIIRVLFIGLRAIIFDVLVITFYIHQLIFY